jgi:hypothetical protein
MAELLLNHPQPEPLDRSSSSELIQSTLPMTRGRITGKAKWLRVLRFGLTLGIALGSSLLMSSEITQQLWGYRLWRPELPASLLTTPKVISVTPIQTVQELDGSIHFSRLKASTLEENLRQGKLYPFDLPQYRALVRLEELGKLPHSSQPMTELELSGLMEALKIESSVSQESRQNSSRGYWGTAILFIDPQSHQEQLYLGIQSSAGKAERFRYYEFLLARHSTLKSFIFKPLLENHFDFELGFWGGLDGSGLLFLLGLVMTPVWFLLYWFIGRLLGLSGTHQAASSKKSPSLLDTQSEAPTTRQPQGASHAI